MVRKLPVIIGSLCAFSASGACSKEGSYHRMSDLRWLCEVAHTWGRNTRGTLPVRGLTIGGDHVRRRRRAALRFLQAWPVTGRNEGISFRQWTDKDMSFVVPKSPSGFVTAAGQGIGIKT